MRILVTGRQGQVACALADLAGERPAELEVAALGRPELDVADRASITHAIAGFSPDIVVNAAVDKAEGDEAAAFSINADGAGNAAAAAGLPIIHLSTDYVFSGDKATPYTEADRPEPQGVYGRSKLAGEEAVAAANPAHAILRTSWVYASSGHNFVRTMLRLAEDREVIRVVADQHGAPDIAAGILAVAAAALAEPGAGSSK